MKDTVKVELVKLSDGRVALKYPHTEPLWDMEGYYLPSTDHSALLKLSAKDVDLLVPRKADKTDGEVREIDIQFEA